MGTIHKDRILEFRGQDLCDSSGDKLGKIEEIYLDAETNEPEWALIHTGLFGTKRTFVPIGQATESDGSLTVSFDKATVKDAPGIEANGQLSQQEEADLYRHYGLDYGHDRSDTGLPEGGAGGWTGTDRDRDAGTAGTLDRDSDTSAGWDRDSDTSAAFDRDASTTGDFDRDASTTGDFDRDASTSGDFDRDTDASGTGRDVSGPATDDAMTRSEEELSVGTREREAGRARLRKYVVTDEVTETVPVKREEVRLEREPITDANVGDAMSGPDLSEEEHEVVLHEEEVVAEKRVVPKERVRLDKDVEVEERTVSEDVSREEIEVDDEGSRGTR
jgi:uncharacterized protein (TIGR02271 family)